VFDNAADHPGAGIALVLGPITRFSSDPERKPEKLPGVALLSVPAPSNISRTRIVCAITHQPRLQMVVIAQTQIRITKITPKMSSLLIFQSHIG
jgi:hypothetical protein